MTDWDEVEEYAIWAGVGAGGGTVIAVLGYLIYRCKTAYNRVSPLDIEAGVNKSRGSKAKVIAPKKSNPEVKSESESEDDDDEIEEIIGSKFRKSQAAESTMANHHHKTFFDQQAKHNRKKQKSKPSSRQDQLTEAMVTAAVVSSPLAPIAMENSRGFLWEHSSSQSSGVSLTLPQTTKTNRGSVLEFREMHDSSQIRHQLLGETCLPGASFSYEQAAV